MKAGNVFVIVALVSVIFAGCSSQVPGEKQPVSISMGTQKVNPVQADSNATNSETENIDIAGLKYDPNVYKGWQVDLRGKDVSNYDLSGNINDLLNSDFDSRTKWPNSLPSKFNPNAIMEFAKNCGLGLVDLHDKGITGRGVNIAIIDRSLLVNHIEYADRIKTYREINYSNNTAANFHACAVTSIACGKSTGVAPQANIYFIGCPVDALSRVKAIDNIIDINKNLPANNKIRVLSISSGWGPDDEGYLEFMNAISRAVGEGIFVVTANIFETYNFYFYGLEVNTLSDRDNFSSYQVLPWPKWISIAENETHMIEHYKEKFEKDMPNEQLLIPIGCKTTSSPTGAEDYVFYKTSGWSWGIPYIAGLYALSCQVKSNINPAIFWNTALKTGDIRTIIIENRRYTGKIVNPQKLIEELKTLK
jgi:subtilisin family serine protease